MDFSISGRSGADFRLLQKILRHIAGVESFWRAVGVCFVTLTEPLAPSPLTFLVFHRDFLARGLRGGLAGLPHLSLLSYFIVLSGQRSPRGLDRP